MPALGIGLKVSTLPVIALGVGVGVDYGIYLYHGANVATFVLTLTVGGATWPITSPTVTTWPTIIENQVVGEAVVIVDHQQHKADILNVT